jgi:hypothetical protein
MASVVHRAREWQRFGVSVLGDKPEDGVHRVAGSSWLESPLKLRMFISMWLTLSKVSPSMRQRC